MMDYKIIETKPSFLKKIFKNKTFIFMDVIINDELLFERVARNSNFWQYKINSIFENKNNPNYCIVYLICKEQFVEKLFEIISKANNNAIILGYKNIDKLFEEFYNKIVIE